MNIREMKNATIYYYMHAFFIIYEESIETTWR